LSSEEEKKQFLESYDSSYFIKKLDEELEPYYQLQKSLMKQYLENHLNDFIHSLPYRCWNENAVVDFCARDLLELSKDTTFERDLYAFIGRQVEDETKHFLMLSRIYEKHTGNVVRPRDVKPFKAQEEVFAQLFMGGEAIKRAIARFASEGGAYYSALVTVEATRGKSGLLDEISRAYETITRDEFFHKKLGEFGLEKFARSGDHNEEIRSQVFEYAGKQFKMYLQIYGYNKDAVDVWNSCYGDKIRIGDLV
jgi:hypothetical protein